MRADGGLVGPHPRAEARTAADPPDGEVRRPGTPPARAESHGLTSPPWSDVSSADETCDVGLDTASPVSDDYPSQGSRFTGTVEWVQIDIADAAEDLDHLVSPEERLKVATARQ